MKPPQSLQMPNIVTLISRNRTELMGIATISVFLHHILNYTTIPNKWIESPMIEAQNWVFTDGFLFLSGFGVFFSLQKNSDCWSFYKKRLKRLYVPFLIISLIPITFLTIFNDESFWAWLTRLTTINFWLEGNFCGMWYVSVTMALYLLSPLLYKLIHGKWGYLLWVVLFFLLLLVLDLWRNNIPKDGYMRYHWIMQSPAFLIGMLVAKTKDEYGRNYAFFILSLFLIFPSFMRFSVRENRILFFSLTLCRLYYLLFFAFLFACMKELRNKLIVGGAKVIKWIGTYSLELYLLHLLIFSMLEIFNCLSPGKAMLFSIVIALAICSPVSIITGKIVAVGGGRILK